MTAPSTTSTAPARSDMALARILWRDLAEQRAILAVAVLLYVPLTIASVVQPLLIAGAVDEGFRAGSQSAVVQWAGLFFGVVVIRATVEGIQGLLMQILGQRAVRTLRVRLFAKLQRLPLAFFDRQPLGRLMTRVTNDSESVAELFQAGAVSLVGDVLFLVGTIVMLFLVDVRLSVASLVVLPPMFVALQWFRRRAREAFTRVRTAVAALNATLQEQLAGMAVVQLFARMQTASAKLEHENEAYTQANKEAIFLDAGIYALVDGVGTIAVAITLVAAAHIGIDGVAGMSAAQGALSLGVLVAFVDALGRFFMPLRELSNKTTLIQSALVAADRIVTLESEPETITAPASPAPARFERDVAFHDVHFAYEGGPPVLQGLTLAVKKGERVAIVGHTGAGKSTIIKLVPRLYDVTKGRITIDGTDVRDFDPRALRRLTTAVPQETFLFQGTIRENLAFGAANASDEALMAAAKACCADEVVVRHGGLLAKVSERGQNLSLGERQLLALTRALIADPPIVILDEATASVDRETERKLQVAQEELLAGRTAIIVAHRLSTIERCDRIILLHHGVVAEEGTHAELMAKGGRYAALVELQRAGAGA